MAVQEDLRHGGSPGLCCGPSPASASFLDRISEIHYLVRAGSMMHQEMSESIPLVSDLKKLMTDIP